MQDVPVFLVADRRGYRPAYHFIGPGGDHTCFYANHRLMI